MASAVVRPRAHIVRVKYEKGNTSLLFATSPDLKGLLVAHRTREQVDAIIPQAITELYAAYGEQVVVTEIDGSSQEASSWVAFPADMAARALVGQAS